MPTNHTPINKPALLEVLSSLLPDIPAGEVRGRYISVLCSLRDGAFDGEVARGGGLLDKEKVLEWIQDAKETIEAVIKMANEAGDAETPASIGALDNVEGLEYRISCGDFDAKPGGNVADLKEMAADALAKHGKDKS